MIDFLKDVIKKKTSTLLIVFGFILILIAFVDFDGLTKFKIKDMININTTNWILFSIAIAFIIIGILFEHSGSKDNEGIIALNVRRREVLREPLEFCVKTDRFAYCFSPLINQTGL